MSHTFCWTPRRRFFCLLGKLLGVRIETEVGVLVGRRIPPDLNIYGADGMTVIGRYKDLADRARLGRP